MFTKGYQMFHITQPPFRNFTWKSKADPSLKYNKGRNLTHFWGLQIWKKGLYWAKARDLFWNILLNEDSYSKEISELAIDFVE